MKCKKCPGPVFALPGLMRGFSRLWIGEGRFIVVVIMGMILASMERGEVLC